MAYIDNYIGRYFNLTWNGWTLSNSVDAFNFFASIVTNNMGATLFKQTTTLDAIFRYAPDASYPPIFFRLYISGTTLYLQKVSLFCDESTGVQSFFVVSSQAISFSDSNGLHVYSGPGFFFFCRALGNSLSVITASVGLMQNTTNPWGLGLSYLKNSYRKDSVPVTVVSGTSVDGPVTLQSPPVGFSVGDAVLFWPANSSGSLRIGTIASISGSVCTISGVVGLIQDGSIMMHNPCIYFHGEANRSFVGTYSINVSNLALGATTTLNAYQSSAFASSNFGSDPVNGNPILYPAGMYGPYFHAFFDLSVMASTTAQYSLGDSIVYNLDGVTPYSGAVVSASPTILTTGSTDLVPGSLVGKTILVTAGNCIAQARLVLENTETTITVSYPFFGTPNSTTRFTVADRIFRCHSNSAFMPLSNTVYFLERWV